MIKLTLLLLLSITFSSCVNKHGVSAKYYSDCDEYYDLQGYYHKDCGKDDVFTYKGAKDNIIDLLKKDKKKPQRNVW
jgi:hypothetical protein